MSSGRRLTATSLCDFFYASVWLWSCCSRSPSQPPGAGTRPAPTMIGRQSAYLFACFETARGACVLAHSPPLNQAKFQGKRAVFSTLCSNCSVPGRPTVRACHGAAGAVCLDSGGGERLSAIASNCVPPQPPSACCASTQQPTI